MKLVLVVVVVVVVVVVFVINIKYLQSSVVGCFLFYNLLRLKGFKESLGQNIGRSGGKFKTLWRMEKSWQMMCPQKILFKKIPDLKKRKNQSYTLGIPY